MEISTAAPPNLSLPTGAKSPDTDQAETPTTATATAKIHPTKSLPFTNGVLKRHAPPHAPSPAAVSYKECMKNHAASMGAHALDGCGEFMPSPSAVPSDPTSLKCAACGCHRNFHRRHTTDDHHHHNPHPISAAPTTHVIEYHPHHRHHPPPPYAGRSPSSPSPPPISSSYYPSSAPHMLLSLSSGGATGGTTIPTSGGGIEQLNSPHGATTSFLHGRKRFRTKFSQDQKDKMHEFAEKLGWKMQKASDEMVAEFCADVGVERGVFKVWMHNNKNTIGKRDLNGNLLPGLPETATHLAAGTASAAATNDLNGSSGNSGNGSHGYSKNGDGTYGSSTSS